MPEKRRKLHASRIIMAGKPGSIFRANRLDAHSDHHFYETEQDALEGTETSTSVFERYLEICLEQMPRAAAG